MWFKILPFGQRRRRVGSERQWSGEIMEKRKFDKKIRKKCYTWNCSCASMEMISKLMMWELPYGVGQYPGSRHVPGYDISRLDPNRKTKALKTELTLEPKPT